MNRSIFATLPLLMMAAGSGSPTPAPSPVPNASPTPRAYPSNPVDTAHGDRAFVRLWAGAAPGAVGNEAADVPKLTLYPAPEKSASGAAVVVCPGGGYRNLASDHEGRQVAEWLNTLGVSAFVLQYRVGPRYRHPIPLRDAERAVRLVRSDAARYAIDPARTGVLGFSAGGHLAASLGIYGGIGNPDATDPVERMNARPDFMVLAYPVISMAASFAHTGSRDSLLGVPADPKLVEELSLERRVTAGTPPAFLFHTADDPGVPVENSLTLFQALRDARVPAELHVFPKGRHGVGLAPGATVLSQWPGLCATWMRSLGLLR